MPKFNKEGYIVRLSESALISIILNGLEAYSVLHKNISKKRDRVKLETFGNLFGYQVNLKDGQKVYQIELVNIDTSSKQTNGDVECNKEAIRLKIDTITSFWPHLEYLGDFHSHPYDSYKEAKEVKGYYLSDGDRRDLSSNSEFWKEIDHKLSLLLTIGPMERAGRRETQFINSNYNCIELNLGNYKIWITAYCSYLKGNRLAFTDDNDRLVTLDSSALTGLIFEHTEYGRIKCEGKKTSHITKA